MNKRALLVGINKYPGFHEKSQLKGCLNDVDLMANLLETRFGFHEKNIRTLRDEDATRDAMLQAMRHLEDVEAGDVVVFQFSGHGSQMTDIGYDEPDGLDETIVPHDSGRLRGFPNRDITDDEIYDWLLRLSRKTTNVTLIIDSCHSATITRDSFFGSRIRRALKDTRSIEELRDEQEQFDIQRVGREEKKKVKGPSQWLPGSARYALLAACRDTEVAHEHTVERGAEIPQGAWTFFLGRELAKAQPGMTYRDIFERAATACTGRYPAQHPQLEGQIDRELFGLSDFALARFVRVQRRHNGQADLAAGAAHGVVPGTRFAVYRQGTRTFPEPGSADDKAARLGTVKVGSVSAVTARGDVESEAEHGAIREDDRAVELERFDDANQLAVELAGTSSDRRELENLVTQLKPSHLLRVAGEAERADVQVRLLAPRQSVDEARDPVPQLGPLAHPTWAVLDEGGHLRMPALRADQISEVDKLVCNLESLARYRQVLQIENPDPNSQLRGKVDLLLWTRNASGDWAQPPKTAGGETILDVGQRVALRIHNRFDRPIYVNLLDLGLAGTVSQLYPAPGNQEPIESNRFVEIGVREGEVLYFKLPERFPYAPLPANSAIGGMEVLKLFVTLYPTDFRPLLQSGYLLGARARSLERRLHMALTGRGPRSARPVRENAGEDWTVVSRSFFLRVPQKG